MLSKRLYILLFFSIIAWNIDGQSGDNPFDLTPRVRAVEAAKKANAPFVPANPFDIKRRSTPVEDGSSEPIPDEVIEENYVNQAEINEKFKRFFFIAFIILLVFLTIGFTLFRNNFSKVWRAFLNDNMLTQVHREQHVIADFPYLFMNFLFFANLALLLQLIGNHYQINLLNRGNWGIFFTLTGAIAGIFIVKHLLLKFVGSVFPLAKEMSLYAFTITVFCAIMGFFLFPLNACIAYLPSNITYTLLGITLGILGLTYLYRCLRGIFIGSRYLASNLFHFLLYICAVEIAPILILLRSILNQA